MPNPHTAQYRHRDTYGTEPSYNYGGSGGMSGSAVTGYPAPSAPSANYGPSAGGILGSMPTGNPTLFDSMFGTDYGAQKLERWKRQQQLIQQRAIAEKTQQQGLLGASNNPSQMPAVNQATRHRIAAQVYQNTGDPQRAQEELAKAAALEQSGLQFQMGQGNADRTALLAREKEDRQRQDMMYKRQMESDKIQRERDALDYTRTKSERDRLATDRNTLEGRGQKMINDSYLRRKQQWAQMEGIIEAHGGGPEAFTSIAQNPATAIGIVKQWLRSESNEAMSEGEYAIATGGDTWADIVNAGRRMLGLPQDAPVEEILEGIYYRTKQQGIAAQGQIDRIVGEYQSRYESAGGKDSLYFNTGPDVGATWGTGVFKPKGPEPALTNPKPVAPPSVDDGWEVYNP